MKTTLTRCLALLGLFLAKPCFSQSLYSYTTATNGSYNSVATNTTGTGVAFLNGSNAPGSPCGTGYSAKNFSSTTTFSTSLAGISVDISPDPGYQLDVTGFSVALRRSGSGPASVRLAYSTDNGSNWTDKGSNDAPNNSSCGTTTTATWSTTFSTANTVRFAIFGFNASGTAGVLQAINLTISGNVTVTLPVELLRFSATSLQEKKVLLEWTTASEINNSHFEIERMDAENTSWVNIGKIYGHGNSVVIRNYAYIDEDPSLDKHSYYRLRQVDFDGKYEYSPVVRVMSSDEPGNFKVYPNPVQASRSILQGNYKGEAKAEIYAANGDFVCALPDQGTEGRFLSYMPSLPAGVYYIRLTIDARTTIKKVIY